MRGDLIQAKLATWEWVAFSYNAGFEIKKGRPPDNSFKFSKAGIEIPGIILLVNRSSSTIHNKLECLE
jgi:hypothetical protein